MATFIDLPFSELVLGAPKVIRSGFTGTKTYVFGLPDDPNRGVIIELNSQGRVLGTWPIKSGRAYRITPQKVRSLPLIEQDPDPIRRFCRKNGLPLTMIVRCERGEEVYFGPAQHQGDRNFRSIQEREPPVALKSVLTIGNPARETKILVVKGEKPKDYEEFCAIAQQWDEVQSGTYVL